VDVPHDAGEGELEARVEGRDDAVSFGPTCSVVTPPPGETTGWAPSDWALRPVFVRYEMAFSSYRVAVARERRRI
jgi:hypothetical protein